jgi:hypothetical protein
MYYNTRLRPNLWSEPIFLTTENHRGTEESVYKQVHILNKSLFLQEPLRFELYGFQFDNTKALEIEVVKQ